MSFSFDKLGQENPRSRKDYEQESNIYTFKSQRIVNAKGQSQIQWKCIIFQSLLCFTNALSLVCASFLIIDKEQVSLFITEVRPNLGSMHHIFLTFRYQLSYSVVFHVFAAINQEKLEKLIYEDLYKQTIRKLVWKIIVSFYFLIHPNQLAQGVLINAIDMSFQVNSLLTMAVLLRIISIVHFVIINSRFYGARVARVLTIYAVKDRLSITYAIKCFFKANGLKIPLFLLMICLTLIPFMRIAFDSIQGQNSSFLSVLYDTVITMTTVGYGDIEHSSSLIVRAGIVLVILAGSFTSSLLTLTFLNYIQLTPAEAKAYTSMHQVYLVLTRLRLEKEIKSQREKSIEDMIKRRQQGNASHQITSPLIKKNKALLKEFRLNISLAEYYKSQFLNTQKELKKIVEKQLLIDNLMRFYFDRRRKGDFQVQVEVKSGRSRKRADDSKRIGDIMDMILKRENND